MNTIRPLQYYGVRPSSVKGRILYASQPSEGDTFSIKFGSSKDTLALISIKEKLASGQANLQVNAAKRIINLKSDEMKRDVIIEFLDVITAKRPMSLTHVRNPKNVLAIFEAGLSGGNLITHRVLADNVRQIGDFAMRGRYIKAFLNHSDTAVQLNAAKKISSIVDEDIMTQLIKQCIQHSNQAVVAEGFMLIREVEEDPNLAIIIQAGLDSSDPYTQSLVSKELDRVQDQEILKKLLNQLLQLNNDTATKSAVPAFLSVASSDFKESVIDQLLNSTDSAKHAIAIRLINGLESSVTVSNYVRRVLSRCDKNLLPLLAQSVSKVMDDDAKKDYVRSMIKNGIGNDFFNLTLVLSKIQDPIFDPLKELCIRKALGAKGQYLKHLINSLEDESLKNRWIHLGLQHEEISIRTEAKKIIDEISDPALKSQWLKTHRESYSPNSKDIRPSQFTDILGQ